MSELLGDRVITAADDVVLARGGLKSNYDRLFGTPEQVARTLMYMFACKDSRPWVTCEECVILGGCAVRSNGYDALLEWLKQEVDA